MSHEITVGVGSLGPGKIGRILAEAFSEESQVSAVVDDGEVGDMGGEGGKGEKRP